MKIVIMSILLLAVCSAQERPSPSIRARTLATSVVYVADWTWNAPTGGPVPAASFNLYQAPGACPASGIPAGAIQIVHSTTLTSFTQDPAPAGTTCTYATSLSAVGVEGPPSIPFQLSMDAPGSPTGVSASITSSASGQARAPTRPLKR